MFQIYLHIFNYFISILIDVYLYWKKRIRVKTIFLYFYHINIAASNIDLNITFWSVLFTTLKNNFELSIYHLSIIYIYRYKKVIFFL